MFRCDLGEVSLDDLVEQARRVSSQIAQLQARHVELVAEIDRRSGRFDGTPTAFVAWQCGLQPGEARRAVSLARRLPATPRLADAFASGALSEGTVRLLASVATPDNEVELLELAGSATAAQLRTLVGRYRKVEPRPAGDQPPAPDVDRASEVRAGWDGQRLALHADLAVDDGIDVEQALRLAGDDLRAERSRAQRDDRLRQLLPDELLAHDRGAALVRMARAYLTGRATAAGLVPEGHHTLIVTTDEALAEHHAGSDRRGNVASGGGPTYVPGGPAVPAWLAAARACHGSVSALLLEHGFPVTATVDARFATPAQKRALVVRDGCCSFPGCGAATGLIAHHIIEYGDGGPTALINLVVLCAQHHNLVHRKRYRITTEAPGRFTFHRADGSLVPAVVQRPPPEAAGPAPDPRPRRTGTHEPLTSFATDVILHHLLTHDGGDRGQGARDDGGDSDGEGDGRDEAA